jgi:hypothetical protein
MPKAEGTSIDHKSALAPTPLKTGLNRELIPQDCRTAVIGWFCGVTLQRQRLFRMGNNLADAVGFALDGEVKAPILIDAGLPSALSFVKFLGAKRGVVKVADQIIDLLDEGLLDRQRRVEAPRRPSAKGGRSSQFS